MALEGRGATGYRLEHALRHYRVASAVWPIERCTGAVHCDDKIANILTTFRRLQNQE